MRIYDKQGKKVLNNILLMLTEEEVRELIDSLESLGVHKDHVHIDDEDYKRQVTIGIYSPQNIHEFNQEIIELIKNG